MESQSGPSGIKIFNPGIFRDGIWPNPGIPGFSGTGFTLIFDPGIVQKISGIFRDFGFCFMCWSNHIIFINLYVYHRHNCKNEFVCMILKSISKENRTSNTKKVKVKLIHGNFWSGELRDSKDQCFTFERHGIEKINVFDKSRCIIYFYAKGCLL